MKNPFLAHLRAAVSVAFKLPPRTSRTISVERNLALTLADGTILLADRHFAEPSRPGPVVLMRTPYSRGAVFGLMASLVAERGFQVVLQSVRGTSGSGGRFDPMRQERSDGLETLKWVRSQPWFSGQLFTFGLSYLGNTQWAMAYDAPELIDGLVLQMTLSNFRDELLSFGGFTQAGTLGWAKTMQGTLDARNLPGRSKVDIGPQSALHLTLPVADIDRQAFGASVPWWQDWIEHEDPADPWWKPIDHSAAAGTVEAPTSMVAGWQDIFLPFQIKDFEARQRAGKPAWLTVGPWNHTSVTAMAESVKHAAELFSAVVEQRQPYPNRDKVSLYLQGADQWLGFSSWPPQDATPLHLYLAHGGQLSLAPPVCTSASTSFVYDPSDPTPSLHGPSVMGKSGDRDMTALESRSDTVAFTGAPLDHDHDVIGPVRVELSIRSDRNNTDFFVCLCDVDSKGRPQLVVDGYVRLRPGRPDADADGVRRIRIDCWPTAYRFRRGHRIRLIVASGAHPRYARNTGTGEPLATATEMVPAHQEILHGSNYPSFVALCLSGAVHSIPGPVKGPAMRYRA